MTVYDIITKKKYGNELTAEEIKFIINGYNSGKIPDYQMAAFLMAVWFVKMTPAERAALTECMLNSGKKIDLSEIKEIKVDKHSTGGVGDGVSLSLAPIVAANGIPVPMMSGRGLGHTGGTLDKLESIPGFSVELTQEKIIKILKEVGVLIMGQTDDVVPADKKIYALRDVTSTVDSLDLISASIMSKKLAEGMDALLLDVKTGKGAFMQTLNDSIALAKSMIEIGEKLNKKIIALITDMNQPLGTAIGNSLEIIQSIEILKDRGPKDITKLVKLQAAYMLILGGKAKNLDEAKEKVETVIKNGKALDVYRRMIKAQNGNPDVIDNYKLFPQVKKIIELKSQQAGYITEINALDVGIATVFLGAGRLTKEDKIDYSVGAILKKKVGDYVEKNETLAEIYVNNESRLEEAKTKFLNAYKFSKNKPVVPPLVYAYVDINKVEDLNIPRD
ncbi:MAG TPA: thymidine phosphorylase [bacterium]|nr:thymidine phosphorylase [bacterium]HOL48893.1 thymidine phosphorylase [bacterium]HPQ20032.1 thymidine phosphorylase [bacterium]